MRTLSVWIDVDSRSGVPIYVQVVEQMRHAIEFGGLGHGERLPTVRRLAGDLAIAPNTIVKAYNELQRMGLVESRPGVGTVVAEGVGEVVRERRVAAIFERLRVLARDAAALGISEDDLWAGLDSEYERIPRDDR
ncbi:MAG: GntR family transcriptional regulator [Actinomycetota bacterium]|nr:GntR family transcriptional regulator [Rubrobacteraceae bacterium]MDQ3183168.1 GntR family transcriptional regulator [Actinomycetota bacterium]MBA3635865.1 GntR family transcriptional regulator [Rubrobacteraceae bacterium]MBA3701402.1 GntR family transcriptional regulator [Rubrobacteraceae bacterium]MDQ3496566.1 GntR family transcriptional regulator [Actinomycetota bacterium]